MRRISAAVLAVSLFMPAVFAAAGSVSFDKGAPVPLENPDLNLMPLFTVPHFPAPKTRGTHYNADKKNVPYYAIITEEAAAKGVDVNLVLAVIDTESDFNAKASSPYARGLMQLTPKTAEWLGLKDQKLIFDPRTNVRYGIKYITILWKMFAKDKDISDLSALDLKTDSAVRNVIAAYNAGPGNVRKYNGIPPFKETIAYVAEVTKEYRIYQAQ